MVMNANVPSVGCLLMVASDCWSVLYIQQIHFSIIDHQCTGLFSQFSLKLVVTSYWIPHQLIELNKILDISSHCVWEFDFTFFFFFNYPLTNARHKCDSLTCFFKKPNSTHTVKWHLYIVRETLVPLWAVNERSLWNYHLLDLVSPSSKICLFSNP